jgi:prepilin-type N-terminal cleavage/methylation domain-containing protein/prepilin-type processing-associated H-X9-DG protein
VKSCSRRRRSGQGKGFTLVELLVVVGIIVVLLGLLVRTFRRSREQASAAVCASNLGQIGKAFLMYAQSNNDKFPYHADWSGTFPADWVHWWPGLGRDPNNLTKSSAIAPYLGNFTAALFHCPADDVTHHPRSDKSKGVYPFSYSMNGLFASNPRPGNAPAVRLTSIRNPSGKMIVLEEDELSLDDGHFLPASVPGVFGSNYENFLGTRHTTPRVKDVSKLRSANAATRPDRNERGNVVFADGHVELVTRGFTWTDQSADPQKP